MSDKMRILVLDEYDNEGTHQKVMQGIPVRYHLWGVHELRDDSRFEVAILAPEKYASLNRLINRRGGNIDQQLRAMTKFCFDAIYATNHATATGLAFLRSAGLFRKPIVAPLFALPPGGRISKMIRHGFSEIIGLSKLQADMLIRRYPEIVNRVSVQCWGWDTNVEHNRRNPENFVLSAGRTMRDFRSFCVGMKHTAARAKIYGPHGCLD